MVHLLIRRIRTIAVGLGGSVSLCRAIAMSLLRFLCSCPSKLAPSIGKSKYWLGWCWATSTVSHHAQGNRSPLIRCIYVQFYSVEVSSSQLLPLRWWIPLRACKIHLPTWSELPTLLFPLRIRLICACHYGEPPLNHASLHWTRLFHRVYLFFLPVSVFDYFFLRLKIHEWVLAVSNLSYVSVADHPRHGFCSVSAPRILGDWARNVCNVIDALSLPLNTRSPSENPFNYDLNDLGIPFSSSVA